VELLVGLSEGVEHRFGIRPNLGRLGRASAIHPFAKLTVVMTAAMEIASSVQGRLDAVQVLNVVVET
jgi:hypothetical protein